MRIKSASSREASTWLKKGNALFDQAKYDEAIPCYDKVIENDPKNKWGLINKGAALSELAKYDEAIECYDKAIELNPRWADAWYNKGESFKALGHRSTEAEAAFAKAKELGI